MKPLSHLSMNSPVVCLICSPVKESFQVEATLVKDFDVFVKILINFLWLQSHFLRFFRIFIISCMRTACAQPSTNIFFPFVILLR